MADGFTVETDTEALLAAIDANPDAVMAKLVPACKVTADNIAAEARVRIRRRSGKTGDAITVEEAHGGGGYVVFVGGGRTSIGRFLEYGTKFMSAKPFLFASARLEEGAHMERSLEAVQAAIDETGLGV
jgi:hypothetical protein